MKRIAPALTIIAFAVLQAGCTKDLTGAESDLYGTWVKGANAGDTLWFMRKNIQNIMRINESFNPGMPNYKEKEFRLQDGVLKIKSFSPASQDYHTIDSFSWTQAGSEFKILGTQLFLFMSSMTYFSYRKI